MTLKVKRFLYLFILIVCLSRSNCQEVNEILPEENDEKTASPRIIGGTNAALGEYPGMISLQRSWSRQHFCGATLLDSTHVLTAAHCVTDGNGAVISPSSHLIQGNSLTVPPISSPNNQTRSATHVFVHEQYNTISLINDVAIIRVSPPFTFTSTFYPATLINSTPAENSNCSVAGWGVIINGTNIASSTLLRVDISIVSNARCNAAYGSGTITSGMICAGDSNGGKDSCQGDSGGGLYCGNSVAGVVSFGYQCGHALFPGVYTNVASYRNWINTQLSWNGGSHSQIPTPTTQRPNSAASTMISIYTVISAFFVLVLR